MDEEGVGLVREAVAVLLPQNRFLLYMKDGENHTVAEMSQVCGVPENTARKRVAERLEELGYENR